MKNVIDKPSPFADFEVDDVFPVVVTSSENKTSMQAAI